MSVSTSLDIAVKALRTQQLAVDTVAHNISNVTTPGYSRQRVRLAAIPGGIGFDGRSGPGQGVESLGVDRIRDIFIDFQFRIGNQALGYQTARAEFLGRTELVVGEPTAAGLRSALSDYFNSWRDLSNQPESAAARTAVTQSGITLSTTAQRIYQGLGDLRSQANGRLLADVDEINALTRQIANFNDQILNLQARGNSAADLRDQRDLAIDRLSGFMDISYFEMDNGVVNVQIGGHGLVRGNIDSPIYGDPDILNNNFVDLKFVDNDLLVNVSSGELRALLDQRDVDLIARMADLNALVGQVIADVNAAHSAGYGLDGITGRDFFSGTDASDIAVDAAVVADSNIVAAATIGDSLDPTVTPPGDGSNSDIISDLQYAAVLGAGTNTYDDFYASFISRLGTATRDAEGQTISQGLLVSQIDGVRQGTSGVNLDEEMVTLMNHQRAYEAAARLIAVIDEMLDTLINRMI